MELHKTTYPGVYYNILQSGKYSYYAKYRDPFSKKSVRKKIFTKDKHTPYIEKQAYNIALSFKEIETKIEEKKEENEIKQIKEELEAPTLLEAGEFYYKEMIKDRLMKLRIYYNYLSEFDFQIDKRVSNKMRGVYKEEKKFHNYFEGHKIFKMKIDKIKREHIKKYLEDISHKSYSAKTTKNIIDKAKAAINCWNKEKETNYNNPFSRYTIQMTQRSLKRVLDEQGLKMLLDKCKEYTYNPSVYLCVYLAVITAARKSTILQIQKKDFDLKSGILYLKNVKVNNQEFKIRLNKESVNYFKKVLVDYEQDEFIIRATAPQRLKFDYTRYQILQDIPERVYTIMNDLFNQDYMDTKRENRDNVVGFHTIRRSVATNLAKKGVPLYKIKLLLNHASIKQTEEYLQMTESEISEDMNELMFDIFN
jgi:integrase